MAKIRPYTRLFPRSLGRRFLARVSKSGSGTARHKPGGRSPPVGASAQRISSPKHSIHYTALPAFLLVFSIWNEKNRCLSWDDTLTWTKLFGLETVPVLYRGIWNEREVRRFDSASGGAQREGYVIRVSRDSPSANFGGLLENMSAAGMPRPRTPTLPVFRLGLDAAVDLSALLPAESDRPLVVLHPGARWASKLWPPASWASLSEWFHRQGSRWPSPGASPTRSWPQGLCG